MCVHIYKIIPRSARRMTLFLPNAVIEFSVEIDEAIDLELRACQHRLIAATHNGSVHPPREASALGNKRHFILTDQPGVIHHRNYQHMTQCQEMIFFS